MATDDGYFSGAGKTAPATAIIRSLNDHGMDHTYIGGVLHGVSPGDPPVPIGESVPKLKSFLGYNRGGAVKKKIHEGGKIHGKRARNRLDRDRRAT